MPTPIEIFSAYSRNSDSVKTLTRSLDSFGISYFYHYRIYNSGKFILFTSNPDVDEYWYREQMFLDDPFIRHPENYSNGFIFVEAYISKDYKNDLDIILDRHKVYPLLSMTKKNVDSFDFFGFWGSPLAENNLKKLQFNHSGVIRSFVNYFLKEVDLQIASEREIPYSILDLVNTEHYYADLPLIPTIEKDALRTFLLNMGMGAQVLKADSLSKREKECIKSLILGKSTKETAYELRLSPRTIEHYFDNTKTKLGCWSKSDLFSQGKQLDELGLI